LDAIQQQRECVAVAQPFDSKFGKPCQHNVADTPPRRAHERDAVSEETTADERKGLRGRSVEPLRVVDDTDQGLVFGGLGEERERGEPDEESVGCRPLTQAEDGREGIALGDRELVDAVE
jgi:hypothetical protein